MDSEQFFKERKAKSINSTGIKKETAVAYINHYRGGLNPDDNTTLRSVWLDFAEIKKFIDDHQQNKDITGIRVYLAKYNNVATPIPVPIGKMTTIIAFTTGKDEGLKDLQDGYFDYGNPCPPRTGCIGDEGAAPPNIPI